MCTFVRLFFSCLFTHKCIRLVVVTITQLSRISFWSFFFFFLNMCDDNRQSFSFRTRFFMTLIRFYDRSGGRTVKLVLSLLLLGKFVLSFAQTFV